MALKPCKECKKEISTEAKVCPNCGKRNPTAGNVPAVVWLLFAIVLIGTIVSLSSSNSPPSTPATPEQAARNLAARHASDSVRLRQAIASQQLLGAVMLCHQAAERRLKAPATAKWHDDEAFQKDLGKGRSHVQFDVDAENSFGAMLRTTVDCKTRQQQNGDVVLTSFDSWQR